MLGTPKNQDDLRDLSLFDSLLTFLSKSKPSTKIFNQGTLVTILNLLVSAIDGNQLNQQHLLTNFKIYDLILNLLNN